jgi:rSAM/selenodomain-associated transferase 2
MAARRGGAAVYLMNVTSLSGGSTAETGAPRISIVVPALEEAESVTPLVEALAAQQAAPPFEVILADGGSADDTVERFEVAWRRALPRGTASVVRCARRGRALQMNQGAARARGDVLAFLHADTLLPPGGLAAIAAALDAGDVVGGGFRLAFRERHAGLAVVAAWASARSRFTGIHYGDQAMFLRRAVFERFGGFPEVPLFEDQRLAARLRREGRVVTLPLAVRTSGRRLLRSGIVRTSLRFAVLKVRHAMGADPVRLAAMYRDVR